LADGGDCDVGPPPAYSEEPGSPFYQAVYEVYDTTNHLSAEQRTIALYWADSPGETGTPPGHSLAIVSQVLAQGAYALDVAAEAYARAGITVADSFISCWWSKYQYHLLRPVTYIQARIDAGWTSLVPTPPFPEYTSGHSVQSAAVAQVMTDLFGAMPFTDRTHEALGYGPRSFRTFWAYAEEAAMSRLYGGIHYRFAIEVGLEQGRCIGQKISALHFRTTDAGALTLAGASH
jgi:hypothetical protein